MVNISYRQTKELIETIEVNKSRGHLKQVQKELNMLNTLLNKKLIPELDELKLMIIKKGTISIIKEYQDLIETIENIDEIYNEVESWKLLC
ncbi:hypothetical protein LJE39_08735 [Clostridium butyricum]|uniref:hypothetical protein n=1 Tax=Clostridium butyricum TaxID=1492 RepID=UPI0021C44FD0|nr:hypothetical protein [Clostridium butyricum]MCQ2013245.1 hypothetical protein [Clostridium butyricum]